jgi:hypothetical protein
MPKFVDHVQCIVLIRPGAGPEFRDTDGEYRTTASLLLKVYPSGDDCAFLRERPR